MPLEGAVSATVRNCFPPVAIFADNKFGLPIVAPSFEVDLNELRSIVTMYDRSTG